MRLAELSTLSEIGQALDLFARVWQAPEREQIPNNVLRAMTSHGSLLLGAFDAGALAGAVFGTWGRDDDGTMWMYSSKLAVDESRRGAGLAERLKRAQADWAAARGIRELRWTFDPMRALNAAFNLAKLGAVGIAFHEDLFGPRADAFNRDERTDRMLVRWTPSEPSTTQPETRTVDIPPDYLSLPAEERKAERDRARDAFVAAFADGLKATGFRRPATYVFSA